MDIVRMEHEALVQADVRGIQEATVAKQAMIEGIQRAETERLKALTELAVQWKRPLRDLTLPNIIVAIQSLDPKFTEQLRSAYNALTILIKRITESNKDNQILVERSLENIHNMKKNILGESVPKAGTYSQSGQKVNQTTSGPRFVSKEV
jgi:flagellar biosynthesis/type III secretory pathway chaperone